MHLQLSKQLRTKFCFLSPFWRPKHETQWRAELRELILHLMGSWVMVKSGIVLCRDEHQQYLFIKWCVFFYERKPQSHGHKGHSGSWVAEKQAFPFSQCPSTRRVTPELGRWTAENRQVSSRISLQIPLKSIYSEDLYLKESSNLTKMCLFLSRCSWTGYHLTAHDSLPCLQISCRCQHFSFSC